MFVCNLKNMCIVVLVGMILGASETASAHMVDVGTKGIQGTFEFGPSRNIQLSAGYFGFFYDDVLLLDLEAHSGHVSGGWKWFENDWFMLRTNVELGAVFIKASTNINVLQRVSDKSVPRFVGNFYVAPDLNINFKIHLSAQLDYVIGVGVFYALPMNLVFPYVQMIGLRW